MKYDHENTAFQEQLKKLIGNDSVSSFARKCGMGESIVRQYLSGSLPRLDKMLQISRANNVTLDWLATGEGPMRPGQQQANAILIEDSVITELKLWLNEMVGEDPDRIGWFRIELQERFQEFKKWREKNREALSPGDQAAG